MRSDNPLQEIYDQVRGVRVRVRDIETYYAWTFGT